MRSPSTKPRPRPCLLRSKEAYFPFISINGSSEIEAATVNLKNLETGDQQAFQATEMDKILGFLSF